MTWARSAAVMVLFLAALAAKEQTIVLPALLLLTDYWWNPGFSFRGIRENWKLYVPSRWARRPASALLRRSFSTRRRPASA